MDCLLLYNNALIVTYLTNQKVKLKDISVGYWVDYLLTSSSGCFRLSNNNQFSKSLHW